MRTKTVSRTCCSVRSSLLAPARLATVRSEAAEAASLHCRDEETAVRQSPVTASIHMVGVIRLDEMPKREYRSELGVEYLAHKHTPAPGLPRRSRIDLRRF